MLGFRFRVHGLGFRAFRSFPFASCHLQCLCIDFRARYLKPQTLNHEPETLNPQKHKSRLHSLQKSAAFHELSYAKIRPLPFAGINRIRFQGLDNILSAWSAPPAIGYGLSNPGLFVKLILGRPDNWLCWSTESIEPKVGGLFSAMGGDILETTPSPIVFDLGHAHGRRFEKTIKTPCVPIPAPGRPGDNNWIC